jgi:methylated-DNA-[protein]-cysteine S-methyltransferase
MYLERLTTPIGRMLLVTDADDRLRAAEWEDYEPRMQRSLRIHYGAERSALTARAGASRARRSLDAYFAGELDAIDGIAVATRCTAFQRDVWEALRAIPVGRTLTYGALAARIARPRAIRAVGLANGANPIGVVVPCHRVIGADAALTGYGGGLERKRWLLDHEGASYRSAPLTPG